MMDYDWEDKTFVGYDQYINELAQRRAVQQNITWKDMYAQQNLTAGYGGTGMGAMNHIWSSHAQNNVTHINVAQTIDDADIMEFVVGDPRRTVFNKYQIYDIDDIKNWSFNSHLFEGALSLMAASVSLAEGETVKIPGVGSVRRVANGYLYFRMYV